MLGMMQDWPLTVDKILDHAKNWHGRREVVTRSVEGPIVRTTYADIRQRALKPPRLLALAPPAARVRPFAADEYRPAPARRKRRPDGLRNDVACAPTGIPPFRWVTGASCCPF